MLILKDMEKVFSASNLFQETSSSKDKDNTNYSPAIRKKADYEYRYYKTNGNGAVQNRR